MPQTAFVKVFRGRKGPGTAIMLFPKSYWLSDLSTVNGTNRYTST